VKCFQKAVQSRGMQTRSYWQQSTPPTSAPWARNLAELICHPKHAERPDGLFIADDNLVPHATAGLLSLGLRVPDDLEIVAHCNFPWPTASMVPAKRIGFDSRKVLAQAISLIDMQRRGETAPLETRVEVLFDDEVDPVSN